MDLTLVLLAVLLGAAIANVIDEIFGLTPRISAWIGSFLGEG